MFIHFHKQRNRFLPVSRLCATVTPAFEVLENVRSLLCLSTIDEFHSVPSKTLISQPGIAPLIRRFGGKMPLLMHAYPSHAWDLFKMDRLPPGFWKEKANHRKFLDYHAVALGFHSKKEWMNIKSSFLCSLGGGPLPKSYTSWLAALESIYPEIDWKVSEMNKLPRKSTKEIHRRWLDEINQENGLEPLHLLTTPLSSFPHSKKIEKMITHYGGREKMINTLYPKLLTTSFDTSKINRSFWTSADNQRIYLEWLIKEVLREPFMKGTGILRDHHLRSNKGIGLRRRHPGQNIYMILQNLYPHIIWEPVPKFPMPDGYWQLEENQRIFFIQFELDNHISSPLHWNFLVPKQNSYLKSILPRNMYKKRFQMLLDLFPTKDFSFSMSKLDQIRSCISYLSTYWNVEIENWGSISKKNLQHSSILVEALAEYDSVFDMLHDFFPCSSWKVLRKKLPQGFWKARERQTLFMNQAGEEFGISKPSDWYTIRIHDLLKIGGGPLIREHKTMAKILRHTFPSQNWDEFLFRVPHGFWKDIKNQKKFLLHLQKKLCLSDTTDLVTVPRKTIVEYGGQTLLNRYQTFFCLLRTVFPDMHWDVFSRVQVPYNYWKDKNNVEAFLSSFAVKYEIRSVEDWERVSWQQIRAEGASGLETRFRSLFGMLSSIYPDKEWNEVRLQSSDKRSAQRWAFLQIRKLFSCSEVIEEFNHSIKRDSGIPLQFDVFIPSKSLAFEYNGEHHYKEIPSFGSMELYQQRDREKVKLCEQHSVHLISIPYSWNNQIKTLESIIFHYNKTHGTDFLVDRKQQLTHQASHQNE